MAWFPLATPTTLETQLNINDYIACTHCDALYRRSPLEPGQSAICRDCGAEVTWEGEGRHEVVLAMAISGLILFAVACSFPVLSIQVGSQIESSSLISTTLKLVQSGFWGLAASMVLFVILYPALTFIGATIVIAGLELLPPKRRPILAVTLRWVTTLMPWSMTGVYVIGIFVSLVKLAKMAEVIPGAALFALIALIPISLMLRTQLSRETLWRRLEDA
ncbi:MAG: paraquat-inducible protein A [Magnetococcales bacterium]|nr:paraquat-inducible protein A [Magnetococcales bacterium]